MTRIQNRAARELLRELLISALARRPEGRRAAKKRQPASGFHRSESEEERRERHVSAPLALSMCRKVRFVGDRDFSLLLEHMWESSAGLSRLSHTDCT